MPIDYSKWDNLDEYSDSDAEDTAATDASTPRVTRLDAPSRVTFGGNNIEESMATIERQPSVQQNQQQTVARLDDGSTPQTSKTHAASTMQSDQLCTPNVCSTEVSWVAKGGVVTTRDSRQLFWSQDRYAFQMRLELRDDEKISSVEAVGILLHSDRHCATGTNKPRLTIARVLMDGSTDVIPVIFEGDLPHSVHLAQGDEEVDWTVERHPAAAEKRFVLVTLHKAVPMQGLFVWWKRPFMEFPEMELEDNMQSTASKEFLQSWEDAHRLFRETKRAPTSLPS